MTILFYDDTCSLEMLNCKLHTAGSTFVLLTETSLAYWKNIADVQITDFFLFVFGFANTMD